MKVTDHFRSEEFDCFGRDFKDGVIIPREAYPREWIAMFLRPLCLELEWLRGTLGAPIIINSGYRSRAYQAELYRRSAKNGSVAKDSQHPRGTAADIHVPGIHATEVHGVIERHLKLGNLERVGGLGLYRRSNFIHLDIRPRPHSGEVKRWAF